MITTLPAQGSKEAADLFLALYRLRFGAHPASKEARKGDDVARIEREMWLRMIAEIEPRHFEQVLDLALLAWKEHGRRGRVTLEDIRTQAQEIRNRFLALRSTASWMAPDEHPISRREYLLEHKDRHQGSPAFAALWRIEFGTSLPGYTPPAGAEKPRVPWLHDRDIARALDPEPDYERKEREAIQAEEPRNAQADVW